MSKSALQSFLDGYLSPNELVVLTVVRAGAEQGTVKASTTEISNSLNGELSRHAVARALRNLQKDNWLTWTTGIGRASIIRVS